LAGTITILVHLISDQQRKMISITGTSRTILSAVATTSALAILLSNASAQRGDPTQDMIKSLGASSPHPSLGDQAQAFDWLVGSWDCDYGFHRDDGSVQHKKGELLAGWILDGSAVQDIFVSYPAEGEKDRRTGTTIRFFDTALKQWRIVFISPQFNYVVTVQGRSEGNRIALRGVDADGAAIRWSFNDIKPDSFVWRGEKSHDGGKTWKLEEEHHMKRRTG
jgi:hypothetical protein